MDHRLRNLPMDFFEAQDRARKESHRLVLLFGMAVGGLILGTYALIWFVLAPDGGAGAPFFQAELFGLVVLGLGLPIAGGTLYRTAQLRKGGTVVAELLGGRRVDPTTEDPRERVLMNVVEEMAIASGVPVPAVFILDQEAGINAFAAGHTLHDAAVAVTQGALEAFTRDELQGVMAHEFSHILNGDMRLNIRLMGLLFGILLLAVIGRGLLRTSSMRGPRRGGSSNNKDGSAQVVIGMALMVVGYLGVWTGRLLQAAISRKREFLADAAAVQFTRNPLGIANALKRIGAAQEGSRIRDSHVDEAGHLFFARGAGRALTRLGSTHPPLPVRIRRIDPAWDGSFAVPRASAPLSAEQGSPDGVGVGGAAPPAIPGLELGRAGGHALAGAILASAGSVMASGLEEARRRLNLLPDDVRAEIRTGEGALRAVVALALSVPDTGPEAQDSVTVGLGPEALQGARALQALPSWSAPELRLPVLELALPALGNLPAERARALVDVLVEVFGESRLRGPRAAFGFVLVHMVRRHLPHEVDGGLPSRRLGTTPPDALGKDVQVLLSLMAWQGTETPADAAWAFAEGWSLWEAGTPGRIPVGTALLDADALTLAHVEAALNRIEGASPGARRTFLHAAAAVVSSDGVVRFEELELLRALSEGVEIPLPPLHAPGG